MAASAPTTTGPFDMPSVGASRHADRHGLEVLSREECLTRLATEAIARVGVTFDALPVIVPVDFAVATLDDDVGVELVVRTVDGTKLHAAMCHAVVAVEVDRIDPVSQLGWSVLVRGRSRAIADAESIAKARQLPLRPWASDDADRYIGVQVDVVTGREVVPWPPGSKG
jgi:hypothetical protein